MPPMRTVRILYICICRLLTQAFPFAVPIAGAPDEWADEEAGIEAVQRILDCLDDIYSLQDAHVDADVLRDMLRDGRLQQFLQLFDRISSSVITTNGRAPTAEAVARSRDVLELLSSVGVGVGNKYAKDELMQLLAAPHLQVSLPPPSYIVLYLYILRIYNVYMYLWLYFVASCVRALKHMIVHIVTALWSYQSVVERMRAPCSARFSISQNKFEMYLVPANRQLPKLDKQTAPALLTSHRHRPRPLSRQSLILRPNCDTHIPRRDTHTHRENVYKQTAPANATKIQTI